jgi:hypothetical protein
MDKGDEERERGSVWTLTREKKEGEKNLGRMDKGKRDEAGRG